MADLNIPRNDKGYPITFTVVDSAGVALPLAGYTITLKMWKPGCASKVSAACAITGANTCTWTLAAADTDTAGAYDAELELTSAGVILSVAKFSINIMDSN